jgi:rubrerythrin
MQTDDTTRATLERLDVDGAIRETAEEATTTLAEARDTRLAFFKKAGIAGGAVMGGGALLGALVPGAAIAAGKGGGRPPASFGRGDIGILNYALTLEYLESSFYNEATANNAQAPFVSGQTAVFLQTVTEDENAHVKALKQALGGKAVKKPKFDFAMTTSNLEQFVATAVALENTGVGAYSGQALNIKDPGVVSAALSILTVEARHASVIGLIQSNDQKGITPNGAFDKPLSAKKVLRAVEKTGFITG